MVTKDKKIKRVIVPSGFVVASAIDRGMLHKSDPNRIGLMVKHTTIESLLLWSWHD